MNPQPHEPGHAGVRAYLQALPAANASDLLWARIQRSQRQRRLRRRGSAIATLAAALFAVALLPDWTRPPPGPPEPAAALAAGSAQLRSIDRQLQAAYDRGASTEQIDALWQRRELLLDSNHEQANDDDRILQL